MRSKKKSGKRRKKKKEKKEQRKKKKRKKEKGTKKKKRGMGVHKRSTRTSCMNLKYGFPHLISRGKRADEILVS